jgi:hypothetical protein
MPAKAGIHTDSAWAPVFAGVTEKGAGMIDNFALALSHGLLLLAAWRLVRRADLDDSALSPPDPDQVRAPMFRKAPPRA